MGILIRKLSAIILLQSRMIIIGQFFIAARFLRYFLAALALHPLHHLAKPSLHDLSLWKSLSAFCFLHFRHGFCLTFPLLA